MHLTIIALAALAAAAPALAHEAPAGWSYEERCCSDQDCAPVADGAVRESGGGFTVTILPGQHPFVRGNEPVRAFFPYGDERIRSSGDHRRHACVNSWGAVLCIYVPPGGA